MSTRGTGIQATGYRLLPFSLAALAALAVACGASNNKPATTVPAASGGAASISAAVSGSPASVSITASANATAAVAGSPAAHTAQIAIANVAFPDTISVKPGTTVTWTNKDSFAHTVTADAGQAEMFDSKPLAGGGPFSVTFAKAGTFSYHCNIHDAMHGKIVVSDAATGVSTPATSPAPTDPPGYKY